MINKKAIGLGLAAAMLVMTLGGCSGSGNANDSGTGNGGLSETPEDEQGSVTFNDAAGDEMTVSSVAERPDELPDEIPLPEDAVIMGAFVQGEKNTVTLTFESELAFESVIKLYQQFTAEAGYTETMPVTVEDDAYWFAGSRETEQLVVIMGVDMEREGIMHGSITYQNNK